MKISTLWKLQSTKLALQFNGEFVTFDARKMEFGEDGKKFVFYFRQL